MDKTKYTTQKLHGIISAIGTGENQCFEPIIFANLPTNDDLEQWDEVKTLNWIGENNLRMKRLCQFMNSEEFSKP